MKHVIVRCEDGAIANQQTAALLESAKVMHLQQLAQAGAAGVLRNQGTSAALDRFTMNRSLLGFDPQEAAGRAGCSYAASINRSLADGEIAWCCDFITQRDGQLIDPTAGAIPTNQSAALIQHLNEQLGSETLRWEVGAGSQHLLIMRDPELDVERVASLLAPEQLLGQSWKRALPHGELQERLATVIEHGARCLEDHSINRVRIDLGENPANMFWLWGAATNTPQRTFTQQTGLSGALVSKSFPMQGLATLLQLRWSEGPATYDEKPLRHLSKRLRSLIDQSDLTYVHLRVATANPVERLCAMERIDQLLLKPLTEQLPTLGPWRLLVVADDRQSTSIPFVAIGTGLPQQPVPHLTTQGFAESPLTFPNGVALFTWLTQST